MYTVIIYLEDEKISIEKYKFIFFSLQEDNQLYLCPWKRGTEVRDIVSIVNEVTQNRQEWKLILFAGMFDGPEERLEGQMKKNVKELIKLYTGKAFKKESRISGFFPEHLYYVVCQRRRLAPRCASCLLPVDAARKFGGSFRMLWFDVDMSCDKNKFYDWFKLNCILLILAVNQIPPGVLEYGYLYHVDIDIDSEQFCRYVLGQEACLRQVEEFLESVGENLQRTRKSGNGYIADTEFNDSLDEVRKSLHKTGNIQKLKRKGLKNEGQLYMALDRNRREVHARLYFPKGVLREEAARVQDRVEKRPGVGEFLSAAGEDLLERKMWEKLEEICKTKRVPLKQTEYERKYEEQEEKIRQCAQRKMRWWDKIAVCFILSIVETFFLAPFLCYSEHGSVTKSIGTFLCSIMEWIGLTQLPSWVVTALTWFIVWVGCFCLLLLLTAAGTIGHELCLFREYNHHISKNIIERQKQRFNYYKEIVNLLAEYQYCIRLLREQRERELAWEENRVKLQHHRNAWKQNSVVCRQLKFFTESEEAAANSPIASFDIQEDPRQIEYYWTPFRESQGRAELNRSGLYIKGIFSFITRVHITKTIW